ncbi:FapA family protein, partial [Paenibacillus sp. MCAF20]
VNGDVDYRVGNIDFVGTVVIRGNVLNGFRINAAGDIRVIGGVEGAELDSEGSIEITGGILGGNKGHVKAGRNVRSSFIQEANVIAGEDILVSQSIMHSSIRAGKSIVCSGAKGLIVGGIVQAGDLVRARTVGNTMSTATAIEVGVKPEFRYELQELRTRLKQSVESLDKTDKALTILDQLAAAGQLSEEKMALRVKLSVTKRQTKVEVEETRMRILEIERSLEDTD